MAMRSCRVTIQDLDGVGHSVEVTASTLYEAVAQGLAAIRGREWVAGVEQSIGLVKVSVADVRVEHEVKLGDFTKWVERKGGSPREVFQRGEDTGDIGDGEMRERDALIVDRLCLVELGEAGVLPRSLRCAGRAQKSCARNGGLLRSG